MADYNLSPNMGLPIPVPGVTGGPNYALYLDNSLTIVDQHNHSAGSGVQITPTGLNINADLSIQGNNVTLLRSARFSSNASVLSLATDLDCVYVTGVDLYFNDGNGNHIRLTQNGAVAGTPGSIANLVSPASASYVSASSKFVFQSAVNTPANLDAASVIIRNLTANSFALTLAPPNAMSSNTTVTLPTLPASQSVMGMDSSGNITASVPYFQALCPTGVVLPFAGSSAPAGFLFCDGSAVSRSTYATLFGIIGTLYGVGDGSTTFNLPNMGGNIPMGANVTYPLASTGGEATHTLNVNEMPNHSHTTGINLTGFGQNSPINGNAISISGAGSSTSAVGGGGPHNNIQPYVAMNYIIKT